MKAIILITLLGLISMQAFSQNFNREERTIEHQLSYTGNDLVLEVGCNVEVATWGGDEIRLQIRISYDNQKAFLIKELFRMDRYDIDLYSGENVDMLSLPNLRKKVRINGEALEESVSFKVLIPADMECYIFYNGHIALTSKNPEVAGL